MGEPEAVDIPLLTTQDAIAEVRRWLEAEQVDPERVFAQTGDQIIRYKDLIMHLEHDTPDGQLLRFAISRGRIMRNERRRATEALFQIRPTPVSGEAGDCPSDAPPPDDTTPSA